jgi:hypothetical protein
MPELFRASSNQLPFCWDFAQTNAPQLSALHLCARRRHAAPKDGPLLRAKHQPLGPSLSYAGRAHPHGVQHVSK